MTGKDSPAQHEMQGLSQLVQTWPCPVHTYTVYTDLFTDKRSQQAPKIQSPFEQGNYRTCRSQYQVMLV